MTTSQRRRTANGLPSRLFRFLQVHSSGQRPCKSQISNLPRSSGLLNRGRFQTSDVRLHTYRRVRLLQRAFRVPTLSLCMIVKNEAAHLEAALESVRGLADEIVVADTGSVDGTREVAARFGARLLGFEWCDDFSAARNFVLEHATGDWVLSIDADE